MRYPSERVASSGRSSRRVVALVLVALALLGCGGGSERGDGAVRSGDVELRVRSVGPADARSVLVVVHGGPGLSLESMAAYDDLAGDDRRVVAYDQRGAGDSTEPADGDWSLDAHLDDLDAVRRWTGRDRVDVLGESWGGVLAAAYAATRPDRVGSLVLVGAVPLDHDEFLAGQHRFRQRLIELQAAGHVPVPLPEPEDGSCLPSLLASMPAYLADPDDDPPDDFTSCDAAVSEASYDVLRTPEPLDALGARLEASFRGRALVVMGEHDAFGLGWLRRSVAQLRRADVEQLVVDDAGHLPAFEQPEVTLGAIDRFLAG